MDTAVIYKLFYPVYFRLRYKRPYRPLKDLLSESQYWKKEEMKEYQNKQLALLQQAMAETEYFSEVFQQKEFGSLNTDNILSLGNLAKETLKTNPEIVFNNNIKDYKIHKTSGTGGFPLKIRVSLEGEAWISAGRKRFYEWWGINYRDRNILIWGKSNYNSNSIPLMSGLEMILRRTLKISVLELSEELFPLLLRRIRRHKPKYFRGYTSAIEQFADLCIENNTTLHELKLKGVIVTSEILTISQREKIGSVFGCPVINEYGANDGGLIAFECPSGGMHIFEEAVLLNTKDNGEVILTDLHNFATPLVNYELGDRIRFKEGTCECGRRLRMIEEIEGRTADFILKSNGQILNSAFFDYMIRDLDKAGFMNSIFKFKIVQKGNIFDFYYIKGKSFRQDLTDHIRVIMNSEIGEDIEINFREVAEIKREESGKLRSFVREY